MNISPHKNTQRTKFLWLNSYYSFSIHDIWWPAHTTDCQLHNSHFSMAKDKTQTIKEKMTDNKLKELWTVGQVQQVILGYRS